MQNEYDVAIIAPYGCGGVNKFSFLLAQAMRKSGRTCLLVTHFDKFLLPYFDEDSIATELPPRPKELVAICDGLMSKRFTLVFIKHPFVMPFFTPLAMRFPTLLHYGTYPGELPTYAAIAQRARDDFLTMLSADDSASKMAAINDHIIRHPHHERADLFANPAYGLGLWATLYWAQKAYSCPDTDRCQWTAMFASVAIAQTKFDYLPPAVDHAAMRFIDRAHSPCVFKIGLNGQKTWAPNAIRTLEILSKAQRACRLRGLDFALEIHVCGLPSYVRSTTHEAGKTIQHGEIPFLEMSSFYEHIDIFSLLSDECEGFPVMLLEAMATGCIPMVSEFVAKRVHPLIVDGRTGFIVKNHGDETDSILFTLRNLQHPGTRRALSVNCRRIVETEYSFKRFLPRLLAHCRHPNVDSEQTPDV